MKARSSWFVVAAVLALAAIPGCEPMSRSKVARGQLYQSGDGRFDGFFEAVHKEQVDASSWSEERKAARRPLVMAVNVTPDASDSAMVEALETRTKKGSKDVAAVTPAIDETSRSELERVKKLEAAVERLDQLVLQGRDLVDQQRRDYANRGADKADEKKSAEMREAKSELGAAVDVASSLASDARRGARSTRSFVADLQRLVGGDPHKFDDVKRADERKPEDPKKPDESKKGDPKSDPKSDAKGDAKKPDAKKPVDKPADPKKADAKPAPKAADASGKPPQKPSQEVFSP